MYLKAVLILRFNRFVTMKFIAALLIGFLFLTAASHAQSFQVGTNVVSAGLGLGGSYGLGAYSATPGISLQYERGMWDVPGPGVVSLGGYLGTKGFHDDGFAAFGYSYQQRWRYTIIGVRSAYHYNGLDVEPLDLYGGAMLSYNILSYRYTDNDPLSTYHGGNYGSSAAVSLYIGARYFFTPKVAAFAELGYGVSYLTLGGAVKF